MVAAGQREQGQEKGQHHEGKGFNLRLHLPAGGVLAVKEGNKKKKKIGFGELTGVYLSDGCSCNALFIQQFAVSFLNKSVSQEDWQLRYVWKSLLLLLLHDLVCCLRNRQDSKLRRRVEVATKEVKAG